MISITEAKELVQTWADFCKEDRADVKDYPACDRDRDEVLALLDALAMPTGKMLVAGANQPVSHAWAKRDGQSVELIDEESAGKVWRAMAEAFFAGEPA
jgi:hypothetical protein